ncbi:DUF5615 family PIN-like protein [Archaeoglobus veneficus]|uniref:DUF5615 domain-containing protein n=1 Tax=Archaeoglobus veneficus (strain DSM 11195 / SNP6) TaxID=693661 RepID=F2KQN3_ARCVS|nr:DUF5615 family PIN-like protein [Archaeoglobus veneficus]AEA46595.1 hypothetical protein Arcve_0573 [Archaeoglobus veneficus SNP6]
MKFLLDDNVPYSVKKWFQKKGLEAVKLFEIGLKGADDETIYRYAIENGFAVITLDLDFGYLFLKFQKGTIIVLRPHRSIPDEIVCLLERSVEVIQEKEGLIVVKPDMSR